MTQPITDIETPELLPCPFCGSSNITFTDSIEEAGGYISWSEVRCDECDANSGYFKMTEPIENWNRRDGVAAALRTEREQRAEVERKYDDTLQLLKDAVDDNERLCEQVKAERERALEEAAQWIEEVGEGEQPADEWSLRLLASGVRALAQEGGDK